MDPSVHDGRVLLLARPFDMGLPMWFTVRGGSHAMRREFTELHAAQNDANHRARG